MWQCDSLSVSFTVCFAAFRSHSLSQTLCFVVFLSLWLCFLGHSLSQSFVCDTSSPDGCRPQRVKCSNAGNSDNATTSSLFTSDPLKSSHFNRLRWDSPATHSEPLLSFGIPFHTNVSSSRIEDISTTGFAAAPQRSTNSKSPQDEARTRTVSVWSGAE